MCPTLRRSRRCRRCGPPVARIAPRNDVALVRPHDHLAAVAALGRRRIDHRRAVDRDGGGGRDRGASRAARSDARRGWCRDCRRPSRRRSARCRRRPRPTRRCARPSTSMFSPVTTTRPPFSPAILAAAPRWCRRARTSASARRRLGRAGGGARARSCRRACRPLLASITPRVVDHRVDDLARGRGGELARAPPLALQPALVLDQRR